MALDKLVKFMVFGAVLILIAPILYSLISTNFSSDTCYNQYPYVSGSGYPPQYYQCATFDTSITGVSLCASGAIIASGFVILLYSIILFMRKATNKNNNN